MVLLNFSTQMSGCLPPLDLDSFLPHPFQYIIHLPSIHTTVGSGLYFLKAALNNSQNITCIRA
jgi:hypothetical protein